MPARHRMAAVTAAAAGVIVGLGLAAAPAASAAPAPYLSHFHTLTTLHSTIPDNGDENPYGIFIIQHNSGDEHAGNVLISNFNDNLNEQGRGTTIVQINPNGIRSRFALINASALPGSCPGGVGLSTALEVLPGGWVVVGSVPSTNGQASTAQAGCLIVLNNEGQVKETITDGINGPWDSVAVTDGSTTNLFVSNVLNGTAAANGKVVNNGYVQRLTLQLSDDAPPKVVKSITIANDYPQRTDPNAFVLGITGLGIDDHGTLHVAETLTSQIFNVPDALTRSGSTGTGSLLTQGNQLNMPLGLALAPNGDILTVNGGNGKIVETTPAGSQVFHLFLDSTPPSPPPGPLGAGALFGLAVRPDLGGVYYVDDDANTLRLLH
jgi:hypothetical protein